MRPKSICEVWSAFSWEALIFSRQMVGFVASHMIIEEYFRTLLIFNIQYSLHLTKQSVLYGLVMARNQLVLGIEFVQLLNGLQLVSYIFGASGRALLTSCSGARNTTHT